MCLSDASSQSSEPFRRDFYAKALDTDRVSVSDYANGQYLVFGPQEMLKSLRCVAYPRMTEIIGVDDTVVERNIKMGEPAVGPLTTSRAISVSETSLVDDLILARTTDRTRANRGLLSFSWRIAGPPQHGERFYSLIGQSRFVTEPTPLPSAVLSKFSSYVCIQASGELVGLAKDGQVNRASYNGDFPPEVVSKIKFEHFFGVAGSFFAISESKELFSWGIGGRGQLGHGDMLDYDAPKPVSAFQVHKIAQCVAHIETDAAPGAARVALLFRL